MARASWKRIFQTVTRADFSSSPILGDCTRTTLHALGSTQFCRGVQAHALLWRCARQQVLNHSRRNGMT
eukprot:6190673-Pleurochrysis_carterae.AAC.1